LHLLFNFRPWANLIWPFFAAQIYLRILNK
jgi:hypothetical protein